MSIVREAARALETGRWNGLVGRALSSAWAPIAVRGLVRPARVPSGIAVICVGGATLGGSGKTRVAIACARALASEGARVVLIGHAYRAAPQGARIVLGDDATRLEDVGDEALVCARALLGSSARVVVAETRQSAIDLASDLVPAPDAIVLDGPLRIRGGPRGALSLLAVDAKRPWGSGRLPPAGDLRAPRDALVACADHIVAVDATPQRVRWTHIDESHDLGSLIGKSVGLFTALARPDRLVDSLVAAGVRLQEIVSVADHGPVTQDARRTLTTSAVDAWVATEKCAHHLDRALRLQASAPLGILEADLVLPLPVRRALLACRPCVGKLPT